VELNADQTAEKNSDNAQAIQMSQISLEQMAATLAHEVRNPLALVSANIDLLESTDHTDIKTRQGNYRIVRRELKKINELLLDFMQMARPAQLEPGGFSPQDVLLEMIDNLRATYAGKNLEFIMRCESACGAIAADEKKLRRAVMNLLKNAIEAVGEKGTVEIDVFTRDGYLTMEIKDNGVGINKEQLQKINEPFYTTKSGGKGLGLFIVRGVVAEHNGTFSLAERENGGCVATVRLPLERANEKSSSA
jgi:two-component system, sporulation sensor kinase E